MVHDGPADAVIMGITQAFDYDMMTRAMHAIADGARFIATNTDSTFPMADRLVPGNGALVAAVATATGLKPEIAGKPHHPIAELVRAQLGPSGLMVGDRADTDGLFAGVVGYDFALVLSGVTTEADLPTDPPAVHTPPTLRCWSTGSSRTDMAARRRLDAELVRRGLARAEPRPGNSSSAARSPSVVLRPRRPAWSTRGGGRGRRRRPPVREPRWREARCGARPLRHRSGRTPCHRHRVVDGWVLRLCVAAGAARVVAIDVGRISSTRRSEPTIESTSTSRPMSATPTPPTSAALAISSSPTSRSSRCASSPLTSSPSLQTVPIW